MIAELPAWAEADIHTLKDFMSSLESLVDAVLVPDLPTGRIRKDSLLTISRIRSFSDVDIIAGISSRHRSLEASVARLIALWEMQVKSVYVVMGDPTPSSSSKSKAYNYAKATQLIALAKDLSNNGKTMNLILSEKVSEVPKFKVGSALLPSREDECTLLEKKVKAGTDYLITQVMFDHGPLASFINSCGKRVNFENLPIFVSLPLVSKPSSLTKLESLDGVTLPAKMKKELLSAESIESKSVELALETFSRCRELKIKKLGAYILPLPGSRMEVKLAEELRKL
ncbi:MAG: methylenetetrahydrofolate reductase [Conexivisphaerales archaeon]